MFFLTDTERCGGSEQSRIVHLKQIEAETIWSPAESEQEDFLPHPVEIQNDLKESEIHFGFKGQSGGGSPNRKTEEEITTTTTTTKINK